MFVNIENHNHLGDDCGNNDSDNDINNTLHM